MGKQTDVTETRVLTSPEGDKVIWRKRRELGKTVEIPEELAINLGLGFNHNQSVRGHFLSFNGDHRIFSYLRKDK
jgi:hypothetical protein